jgi:thiosulfate/3-mercaptopyruvate sulfurtransferase
MPSRPPAAKVLAGYLLPRPYNFTRQAGTRQPETDGLPNHVKPDLIDKEAAMRIPVVPIITVILWPGVGLGAEAYKYPRPDLLLEPEALAKPEVTRQFTILDVRSQEEYQQEHLPGARRVDHDEWKTAFDDGKDAEGWGKRIGQLGIGPRSKVVVYDDNRTKDAARIWWILRYWGLDDVRLLNGGWKTWKAAGYPIVNEPPPPDPPAEFQARPRHERLATLEQVLRSLRGGSLQIVDARSEDEFCGVDTRDSKRGGAIPGAKHLQWSDLIDQATQRFKSPAELRRLFDQAGIDLDRPSAAHCESGGRASVMVFGLELMGAKNVSNYYRGWSEWGNAENTPIVVPEKKAGGSAPK